VNLLLDTHAVLWWLEAHPRLGREAERAIRDPANRCLVSSASVFEIETKARLGKLLLPPTLQLGWESTLSGEAWEILVIDARHARLAARWAVDHGDPFDRLLAAQAAIENLALITCDPVFVRFGIRTLW
jgi:PIN domain nuclease of toxin-antitoxin system